MDSENRAMGDITKLRKYSLGFLRSHLSTTLTKKAYFAPELAASGSMGAHLSRCKFCITNRISFDFDDIKSSLGLMCWLGESK
jgi:hypothetical protein